MTVVYCIFSLEPPHGTQRALTVKVNYLADVAGYNVHVVTYAPDQEPPFFALSTRVELHYMGADYQQELTALLYRLRPDVSVSLYGEESRWLYKIGDGSRKVLEFHFTRNHLLHLVKGLPNVRFRKLRLQYARFLQYRDERCARHYDRLVLLTEADMTLWESPPNAVVIPNPLSFVCPDRSEVVQKRILSVGRLIAAKGFDLLIDAYRMVAIKHPDWTLTIFGDGQDKEYLLSKIRRYGIRDQVEIRPPTADIEGELLRSSIYAASSRYEGFGLVITEAMECGVPCVAFDCECGPREIIRDRYDGLLVEPLNAVAFSKALMTLIEEPVLRARMGRHARISAGRFSVDKVMEHWQSLFENLLANTPVHA